MTNVETLELGLALAELDLQLTARGTLTSPEEASKMLRAIQERRAAERENHRPPLPDGKILSMVSWGWRPAAIIEKSDGTKAAYAITRPGGNWTLVNLADVSFTGRLTSSEMFDALVASMSEQEKLKPR